MRFLMLLFVGLGGSMAVACLGGSPADPKVGKQLATRYQCASCHGADMSGSDFPMPGTLVYASNLTPNRSGLALLSDDEITAAVTDGVGEGGVPLCDSMPRFSLSASHASALVAYLRLLPAVAHDVPASDCAAVPTSDLDDAGPDDAGVIIVK